MTNDQIKINRVDLHTSCPISGRIKRLECQLENQRKYTTALEEDLEDRDKLIENLRLDLKALEDDIETKGSAIECLDCKDLRSTISLMSRVIHELSDDNMVLRSKIRRANEELKGIGE